MFGIDKNSQRLVEKLEKNERLSEKDGLDLYNLPLSVLGFYANQRKEKRFQNKISFIRNYYMNFTNICCYACKYCGFRRNKGDTDAYTLSLEELERRLRSAPEKVSEVWFSSGLNKSLPFSFYIELIQMVKKTLPSVQLKAFTAVEIDFFSKHFKLPVEEVLDELMSAGLDRIPGGGAEIFDDRVRKKIDIKTRPESYLEIHRLCHRKGMKTAITMLFGHVEERSHRIRHMLKLRDFQEDSGGVQAFIPLAYQDKNNPLAKRGVKGPHPVEVLKTLSISRLLLDNVDHIQSFWVDSGEEVTQIGMHYGIDDINGTLIEENIAHESGSKTKAYEPTQSLIDWIEKGGLEAIERDAFFKTLKEF